MFRQSYRYQPPAQVLLLAGGVLLMSLVLWSAALGLHHAYQLSLWLCLLAYLLGMRHGIDLDHIAAIDNVTRKLVAQGETPISLGLYFALGHASIVCLLSAIVAISSCSLNKYFASLQGIGSTVGAIISGGFLLLFAIINFGILCGVVRALRTARAEKREGVSTAEPPSLPLATQDDLVIGSASAAGAIGIGFMSWLLRPLLRIVSRSWHMYGVGFLFGLGFDTATEIAVLGIAGAQAVQAVQHGSLWPIMIFPGLFAAGMVLADTASSLVMLAACRWACTTPGVRGTQRRLRYNLVLTAVSLLMALLVGGHELAAVL